MTSTILSIPQFLKPLKSQKSLQQSRFIKYALKYIKLENQTPFNVYLNLYSLTKVRIGAYHTGIQIFDTEIAFGGHQKKFTGIYFIQPKSNEAFYYQRQISLGQCSFSVPEVVDILDNISQNWMGKDYKILLKNCNDFSDQLSMILLQRPIPKWINGIARFGRKFM